MEIKGKIIQKLPPMSGTSKAGNAWNKQEYVLETQDAYPRKVFFDFFGERANQYPLEVGDVVTLSFDIESREFNGKWYTSIRGWKAERETATAPQQPAAAAPAPSAWDSPPQVPLPRVPLLTSLQEPVTKTTCPSNREDATDTRNDADPQRVTTPTAGSPAAGSLSADGNAQASGAAKN